VHIDPCIFFRKSDEISCRSGGSRPKIDPENRVLPPNQRFHTFEAPTCNSVEWLLKCIAQANAMADRIPFRVNPMLAILVDRPFEKLGWIYEQKYDGYRILAYKEGSRVTLLTPHSFFAVADAVRRLSAEVSMAVIFAKLHSLNAAPPCRS